MKRIDSMVKAAKQDMLKSQGNSTSRLHVEYRADFNSLITERVLAFNALIPLSSYVVETI